MPSDLNRCHLSIEVVVETKAKSKSRKKRVSAAPKRPLEFPEPPQARLVHAENRLYVCELA